MANRAAGKGYENEDNYSNIRFQFVGIENIHVMRGSLQKLLEGMRCCCMRFWFILISFCGFSTSLLCASLKVIGTRSLSMPDYLVGLENSGWLRHIKAIMDAAIFLAKVKLRVFLNVVLCC